MGNKDYEIKNRNYNDNYNNDFEERGNIYEEDDNYESYESGNTDQSQDSYNSPKDNQFAANVVKLFIFLFLAILGTGGFIAYKFFDDQVNKEEENNNLKPKFVIKKNIEDNKNKDNGFDIRELAKKNNIRVVGENTANDNYYKTPKVFKLIDNKSTKDVKKSIKTNADKSFEENKLKEFRKKFIDKEENKSKFEKEFVPTIPREATGPKKDIANYYYLTEEQLIKEVNDSFKTDYDYYIRGSKYNRGQVKATLTTITQQKNYLKLLELLLTKGFATNFMGQNEDFDILSMTYYHAATDNREYLEILLKHGEESFHHIVLTLNLLHASIESLNILYYQWQHGNRSLKGYQNLRFVP